MKIAQKIAKKIAQKIAQIIKDQLFWEGHKNLNYPTLFLNLLSNVKTLRTIASNFCGLLRKAELYIRWNRKRREIKNFLFLCRVWKLANAINLNRNMTLCMLPKKVSSCDHKMDVCYALGSMAIPVVQFSREGYKIEKVFGYKFTVVKWTHWILRIGVMGRCRKVPKFDFQSQFSMTKIIQIFLTYFFHWRIQIQEHIFFIDIFW